MFPAHFYCETVVLATVRFVVNMLGQSLCMVTGLPRRGIFVESKLPFEGSQIVTTYQAVVRCGCGVVVLLFLVCNL